MSKKEEAFEVEGTVTQALANTRLECNWTPPALKS